jgi:hypothetical protein
MTSVLIIEFMMKYALNFSFIYILLDLLLSRFSEVKYLSFDYLKMFESCLNL